MRGFESRSSRYLVMLSILPCSSFRSESRCSLSFRLAFIKNETKETYRYENSDFQKLKSDVVKISLSLFVSLYESLSLPLSRYWTTHLPQRKKVSTRAGWLRRTKVLMLAASFSRYLPDPRHELGKEPSKLRTCTFEKTPTYTWKDTYTHIQRDPYTSKMSPKYMWKETHIHMRPFLDDIKNEPSVRYVMIFEIAAWIWWSWQARQPAACVNKNLHVWSSFWLKQICMKIEWKNMMEIKVWSKIWWKLGPEWKCTNTLTHILFFNTLLHLGPNSRYTPQWWV